MTKRSTGGVPGPHLQTLLELVLASRRVFNDRNGPGDEVGFQLSQALGTCLME